MRTFYYIMLRAAYVMADIAEYIADPIVNAMWNAAGALEYWASEKLNIEWARQNTETIDEYTKEQ